VSFDLLLTRSMHGRGVSFSPSWSTPSSVGVARSRVRARAPRSGPGLDFDMRLGRAGDGVSALTTRREPTMDEEPEVRITISRVLNVGYALKERLERVAAAEGVDATYLGRRIVDAGVSAREQVVGEREAGHE
jgi:hypothetical protein